MTNSQIILEYMLLNELDPTEVVLHTFQQWKNKGYQVKKGEKSQHKIPIWMPSTKKVKSEDNDDTEEQDTAQGEEEEKTNGRFFMKNAAFFYTRSGGEN